MSRGVVQVQVQDPAGPRAVAPVRPATVTGAERLLLAGASALALAGVAVLSGVVDGPVRAALVGVESGVAAGQQAGVQEVLVTVRLRNLGRTPLRVVAAQLDGAGPSTGSGRETVAPRRQRTLVLRWRVRCAEVGSLPGPQALTVLLRDRAGRSSRSVLPLAGSGRGVRRAASLACAAGAA